MVEWGVGHQIKHSYWPNRWLKPAPLRNQTCLHKWLSGLTISLCQQLLHTSLKYFKTRMWATAMAEQRVEYPSPSLSKYILWCNEMSIHNSAETQLAPISFVKVAWVTQVQKVGDEPSMSAYVVSLGKLEANARSTEGKKLQKGGSTCIRYSWLLKSPWWWTFYLFQTRNLDACQPDK